MAGSLSGNLNGILSYYSSLLLLLDNPDKADRHVVESASLNSGITESLGISLI